MTTMAVVVQLPTCRLLRRSIVMLKLVALGFWRESVLRDWVRSEGRGRRVGAMQVSQALNSSNISNYVTSITLLKVERPNFDNIWEYVHNFVDGRV